MADCLEGSSPNWMEDGYGIQGPQGESSEEDLQDWDTNAWSDNSQANEDFASVGNTGLEVGTQAFYGGYLGNVNNVTEIHFDESLFLIQDDGGGNVWYHSIPRPAVSVYLQDGKVLLIGGSVATDPACCCFSCAAPPDTYSLDGSALSYVCDGCESCTLHLGMVASSF